MDKTDVKDDGGANGCCIMNKNDEKVEKAHVNGNDEKDSNSLLPPRRGGMSRKSDKTRRKVQWNDKNGNKLAEVLVYEPRLDLTQKKFVEAFNLLMTGPLKLAIIIVISEARLLPFTCRISVTSTHQ